MKWKKNKYPNYRYYLVNVPSSSSSGLRKLFPSHDANITASNTPINPFDQLSIQKSRPAAENILLDKKWQISVCKRGNRHCHLLRGSLTDSVPEIICKSTIFRRLNLKSRNFSQTVISSQIVAVVGQFGRFNEVN